MMADYFGYRPIFYITGALLFIASILALFFVKEDFVLSDAKKRTKVPLLGGFRPLFKIPELFMLNSTTVVIQFALLSPVALIPLFVQQLSQQVGMLAFYAGLITSINGVSNMITAPLLGKLGDKVGAERILFFSLLGSAIVCIPQAFVQNIGQLIAIRFALGIFMGGLLPSVNVLIGKYAPLNAESRVFSLNSSMYALGSMLGPLMGGFASEWISIRGVFIVSGLLLAACAVWTRKLSR
jgi:MFS family permease